MIYSEERLKELIATQDQNYLYYILEELKQHTVLLKMIAGIKDEVVVVEEVEKPKMGRPRKVE